MRKHYTVWTINGAFHFPFDLHRYKSTLKVHSSKVSLRHSLLDYTFFSEGIILDKA